MKLEFLSGNAVQQIDNLEMLISELQCKIIQLESNSTEEGSTDE
jgi:hypothetical protein